ncbi:MAG: hypothetical protein IT437_09440 [Phycisphaerales bacterium]|nr:hypothetical protein [Phycisphaerales bacterium]
MRGTSVTWAAWAALGVLSAPSLAGAQPVAPVPVAAPAAAAPGPEVPEQYRTLLATCDDPTATKDARDAAGARLVAGGDPGVVAAVTGRIAAASPAAEPLLGAIARSPTPRAELFAAVRDFVQIAPDDRIVAGLSALGSFRTPEAVETLLAATTPQRPSAVRAAAFRALGRLTGRDDLAEDRAGWLSWYEDTRGLDRAEWNAVIVAGLARRSDRLAAEQARAGSRLTDAFRRLYLVVSGSTTEDRPALLVSLLLDDRDELRSLGFELVTRELSAGGAVDPTVGAAVIRLLGHGSATVRAQAAALVSQMAPAGAGEAVAAALSAEKDPVAAAALLTAAARWPTPHLSGPAIRWATNGPETRAGAVQLLLALARAEMVTADEVAPVCRLLMATDPLELTPPELRLLAAMGGQGGREHVAAALKGAGPGRRLAAAEALCEQPGFGTAVLDAAATDPALFDAAARAVASQRMGEDGLRRLLHSPAPTPAARNSGVAMAAEMAPLPVVAHLAADLAAPADRELLLGYLMEPRIGPSLEDPSIVGRGLLLLAQARLDMGRPDAALPTLAAIPEGGGIDPATIQNLRTVALLWTGKIEEAAESSAPVGIWLDGLERAITQPHADEIAKAIESRFGATMSPVDRARLAALTERARAIARDSQVPPP